MTEEQKMILQVVLIGVSGLIFFGLIYLVIGRMLGKVKTELWQVIVCVVLGLVAEGIIAGWLFQMHRSRQATQELEELRRNVEAFEAEVEQLKQREADYWELRKANEAALGKDYSKTLTAEELGEHETEESEP